MRATAPAHSNPVCVATGFLEFAKLIKRNLPQGQCVLANTDARKPILCVELSPESHSSHWHPHSAGRRVIAMTPSRGTRSALTADAAGVFYEAVSIAAIAKQSSRRRRVPLSSVYGGGLFTPTWKKPEGPPFSLTTLEQPRSVGGAFSHEAHDYDKPTHSCQGKKRFPKTTARENA